MLLGRLPRKQLTRVGSVSYASQGPTRGRFAVFPQTGMNLKGGRFRPWRCGGDIRRVGVQREVSRGVKREGGSRQAMTLFVVGAGCKPAREHAEINRSVTAAAASFVDGSDGCQQVGNGRSCL